VSDVSCEMCREEYRQRFYLRTLSQASIVHSLCMVMDNRKLFKIRCLSLEIGFSTQVVDEKNLNSPNFSISYLIFKERSKLQKDLFYIVQQLDYLGGNNLKAHSYNL